MKIAVTGANGFIGRHLASELDRRDIPASLMFRQPPTDLAPGSSKHRVVVADIGAPTPNTYELLGSPDVLIHLAWGGLPNYNSLHHFEEELPNQFRFLRTLIESGLQNLLVAGTCFEYGLDQSGPLGEGLLPKPTNPYGFAKDALRCQLNYLQQTRPFNLTWARLFYLYGDGQAATSILPLLKRAVEANEQRFNMSGGEQLRDYLSVTEAAKHLVDLAMTLQNNGPVNVCSGKPISVRRLVESWIAEHKWTIELNLGHYPYPNYEPMAFWGDRRKLDQCLSRK